MLENLIIELMDNEDVHAAELAPEPAEDSLEAYREAWYDLLEEEEVY